VSNAPPLSAAPNKPPPATRQATGPIPKPVPADPAFDKFVERQFATSATLIRNYRSFKFTATIKSKYLRAKSKTTMQTDIDNPCRKVIPLFLYLTVKL
jgi:hypothetical protein